MKRIAPTLAATLLVLAGAAHSQEQQKEKDGIAPAGASRVELVLCLDTSNSMDALIDSAKMKLWDIVNVLASAEPAPELRVALYSYGNDTYTAESGWVRRDLDFTDDLDAVYEKLFNLKTNGGTEYVSRVTKAAVEGSAWRPMLSSEKDPLRLIFVAGNEPADQDQELSLEKSMSTAAAYHMFVNTIYCGNPDDVDAQSWRAAASLGKGKFAAINAAQTVAIATPYDDELARLSAELNKTYVGYGRRRAQAQLNQSAQDSNAMSLSSAVAADRAKAKASRLYSNSTWDLVDAKKEGVKLAEIAEEELPEELQKLTPEELEKHVAAKGKERAEIQAKIAELGNKRDEFVKQERAKQSHTGMSTFDKAIREALTEQAAKVGMKVGGDWEG